MNQRGQAIPEAVFMLFLCVVLASALQKFLSVFNELKHFQAAWDQLPIP